MRYARSRQGPLFFSSTAVVLAELIKAISAICLFMVQKQFNMRKFSHDLLKGLIDPIDNLKIFFPSLLFVIQNNLIYLSISLLDAATFQVSSQLKILTTAIFSVLILPDRHYSHIQWFALIFLFVGVVLVQWESQHLNIILLYNNSKSNRSLKQSNIFTNRSIPKNLVTVLAPISLSLYSNSASHQIGNQTLNYYSIEPIQLHNSAILSSNITQITEYYWHHRNDQLLGFLAVFLASVTSGIGNVYFEKVLKSAH